MYAYTSFLHFSPASTCPSHDLQRTSQRGGEGEREGLGGTGGGAGVEGGAGRGKGRHTPNPKGPAALAEPLPRRASQSPACPIHGQRFQHFAFRPYTSFLHFSPASTCPSHDLQRTPAALAEQVENEGRPDGIAPSHPSHVCKAGGARGKVPLPRRASQSPACPIHGQRLTAGVSRS